MSADRPDFVQCSISKKMPLSNVWPAFWRGGKMKNRLKELDADYE